MQALRTAPRQIAAVRERLINPRRKNAVNRPVPATKSGEAAGRKPISRLPARNLADKRFRQVISKGQRHTRLDRCAPRSIAQPACGVGAAFRRGVGWCWIANLMSVDSGPPGRAGSNERSKLRFAPADRANSARPNPLCRKRRRSALLLRGALLGKHDRDGGFCILAAPTGSLHLP